MQTSAFLFMCTVGLSCRPLSFSAKKLPTKSVAQVTAFFYWVLHCRSPTPFDLKLSNQKSNGGQACG